MSELSVEKSIMHIWLFGSLNFKCITATRLSFFGPFYFYLFIFVLYHFDCGCQNSEKKKFLKIIL